MNENFCPAPWNSLFYHYNNASICCVHNTSLPLSPFEFQKDQSLTKIKEEFLAGIKPESCSSCWKPEKLKLQSIRNHFLNRFPNIDLNQNVIRQLELRASNLCNFKCRMCSADDSIEIAREKDPDASVTEISDSNWEEIKIICKDLSFLTLTGGEPMLIKKYYDLLDYLIEQNLNETIVLSIYTNCSVFNPKFIDRLLKFKNVMINASIDAIGKIAEYQRKGTNWNTVESNILKLISYPSIKFSIHSTISAYTILGIDEMSSFLIKLSKINPNLYSKIHTVHSPIALHISNLPNELKTEAIKQIDSAIEKLNVFQFASYINELIELKKILLMPSGNSRLFAEFTRQLDIKRNESFESVFGYKLYN
jgi:organic radical activating enzyme